MLLSFFKKVLSDQFFFSAWTVSDLTIMIKLILNSFELGNKDLQ